MGVEDWDVSQPLEPTQARKLLSYILTNGSVSFSSHALEELANDGCSEVDARNVLKGGQIYEPAEERRGTWRYRVHTARMGVVIAFDNVTSTVVVTAWVKKR